MKTEQMKQLGKVGFVLASNRVKMNLEDLLRNNMSEYSENGEP